jgi:hypothetical protein
MSDTPPPVYRIPAGTVVAVSPAEEKLSFKSHIMRRDLTAAAMDNGYGLPVTCLGMAFFEVDGRIIRVKRRLLRKP